MAHTATLHANRIATGIGIISLFMVLVVVPLLHNVAVVSDLPTRHAAQGVEAPETEACHLCYHPIEIPRAVALVSAPLRTMPLVEAVLAPRLLLPPRWWHPPRPLV